MTLEMLIIALVRVLGSLPVLRWAFAGALLAMLVDQSDLLIMNVVDFGGVSDYQTFDKYLDQVYLGCFLVVALRWTGLARNVSIGLYVYRLVGAAAFELTQERDVLLFFPNLFEFWFVLVAGLKHFDAEKRLTSRPVVVAMVGLVALKMLQEYALHYGQWLDGFTTVEAIESIWRWLTQPLR